MIVLDPTILTGFHKGRFIVGDDGGIYLRTEYGAIPLAHTDLDELTTLTNIGSDWFTYDAERQATIIAAPVSPASVGDTVFEGAIPGTFHAESVRMSIALGLTMTRAISAAAIPAIRLSATSIAEGDTTGRTVGALSVVNGSGSYTFSETADPDSKFSVSGSNLLTSAALDYETKTSHSVTIQASNGVDDPISATFTITVTNVLDGPSLSALTLSVSEITVGEPVTINILGAAMGSTLTADALPAGLALNSGAATITGTPSEIAETAFDLTETLTDSPNSPRVSSVSIEVVEAAPVTLPSNWRGAAALDSDVQSDYDTWAGADADFIWLTTNHDSWLNFDAAFEYWLTEFTGDTRPIIWSLPLTVDGTSLASVAGGSNDANFVAAAEAMRDAAPDDNSAIIIRLGWEADFTVGGNPAWAWTAVGVESDYIAAFRRVHGLLRAVSPRFMFDWCLNYTRHSDSYDPSTLYPGDAYVDIISNDLYYRALLDGNGVTTQPDPIGVWNYIKSGLTYGLDWIDAFAAAHSKPRAIPEWGFEMEKPQWVELAADYMESLDLVYQAIFDNNIDPAHQTRVSDGSKGLAGHAYLMRFGTDAPTYGAAAIAGSTNGVIGSGGALPTGWGSSVSNVTMEVLGTGVADGVAYIDIEIAATGTALEYQAYGVIWLPFNWDGTSPAAAQSEVWRGAVAAKIQSSTGGGASIYAKKLIELDGSFASNGSTDEYPAADLYAAFPLYADHHTVTRKLVEADAGSAVFELDVFLDAESPGASAVVRIAAPVLTKDL